MTLSQMFAAFCMKAVDQMWSCVLFGAGNIITISKCTGKFECHLDHFNTIHNYVVLILDKSISYYHPRTWVGNVFSHVCYLCVYVSVCLFSL